MIPPGTGSTNPQAGDYEWYEVIAYLREDAGALAAAGHARRAGREIVVMHTHFHTHC